MRDQIDKRPKLRILMLSDPQLPSFWSPGTQRAEKRRRPDPVEENPSLSPPCEPWGLWLRSPSDGSQNSLKEAICPYGLRLDRRPCSSLMLTGAGREIVTSNLFQ
jgi:hypothetical protein